MTYINNNISWLQEILSFLSIDELPTTKRSCNSHQNIIITEQIKSKARYNNYLLTGNKVAEGNNSSRVCRGEKKALYYRLIRNFIFSSSLY